MGARFCGLICVRGCPEIHKNKLSANTEATNPGDLFPTRAWDDGGGGVAGSASENGRSPVDYSV